MFKYSYIQIRNRNSLVPAENSEQLLHPKRLHKNNKLTLKIPKTNRTFTRVSTKLQTTCRLCDGNRLGQVRYETSVSEDAENKQTDEITIASKHYRKTTNLSVCMCVHWQYTITPLRELTTLLTLKMSEALNKFNGIFCFYEITPSIIT